MRKIQKMMSCEGSRTLFSSRSDQKIRSGRSRYFTLLSISLIILSGLLVSCGQDGPKPKSGSQQSKPTLTSVSTGQAVPIENPSLKTAEPQKAEPQTSDSQKSDTALISSNPAADTLAPVEPSSTPTIDPQQQGIPFSPADDPLYSNKENNYYMPEDFILTASPRTVEQMIPEANGEKMLLMEAMAFAIRRDRQTFDSIAWVIEESLADDYRTQLAKLRFEPTREQIVKKFMENRDSFIGPDGKAPEKINLDIAEMIRQDLYISQTEKYLEERLTEAIGSGKVKLTAAGNELFKGSTMVDRADTELARLSDPEEAIKVSDIQKMNLPSDLVTQSDVFRNMIKRKLLLREGRRLNMEPSDTFNRTMASVLVETYLEKVLGPPPVDFTPQAIKAAGKAFHEPTEKELNEYYTRNLVRYTPPRVDWIKWITFASREEALKASEKIAAGASFEVIARDNEQSGQPVDGYPASNLQWDMDSIISRMDPGQCSKVVAAEDQWVIVKLMHRSESRPISFENARPAVRQDIFTDQWNQKRSQSLADLRARALKVLWEIEPWPTSVSGSR